MSKISLNSAKTFLNEHFKETIDKLNNQNITVSFDIIKTTYHKKVPYIAVIVYVYPQNLSFSEAKNQNKLNFFIKVYKEHKFVVDDKLLIKIQKFLLKYKVNQNNFKRIFIHLYYLCCFNDLSMKILTRKVQTLVIVITLIVLAIVLTANAISAYKLRQRRWELIDIWYQIISSK